MGATNEYYLFLKLPVFQCFVVFLFTHRKVHTYAAYTCLYLELEDFIVHRALLGVEDVEEHFWGFY